MRRSTCVLPRGRVPPEPGYCTLPRSLVCARTDSVSRARRSREPLRTSSRRSMRRGCRARRALFWLPRSRRSATVVASMRSSSEQSRLILVEARRCVHQRARPCIITRVEYSTRKPATGGLVALDDLPAESGRPKCHKRIGLRTPRLDSMRPDTVRRQSGITLCRGSHERGCLVQRSGRQQRLAHGVRLKAQFKARVGSRRERTHLLVMHMIVRTTAPAARCSRRDTGSGDWAGHKRAIDRCPHRSHSGRRRRPRYPSPLVIGARDFTV